MTATTKIRKPGDRVELTERAQKVHHFTQYATIQRIEEHEGELGYLLQPAHDFNRPYGWVWMDENDLLPA